MDDIGASDGLPKGRRFCLRRARVSGCPGPQRALGAVEMLPAQATGNTSTVRPALQPAGCVGSPYLSKKSEAVQVGHADPGTAQRL